MQYVASIKPPAANIIFIDGAIDVSVAPDVSIDAVDVAGVRSPNLLRVCLGILDILPCISYYYFSRKLIIVKCRFNAAQSGWASIQAAAILALMTG